MSLHNGIDLVAVASHGVYSETYDSVSNPGNIANLYASRGLFEDAPDITIRIVTIIMSLLDQFNGGSTE